jgi:Protein of unknown function (DUF3237)
MGKLLGEALLGFAPEHYRIGPAPDEIILHYVIASGTFHGARLRLSAIPNCGAEWNRVGGDGVMAFESRQVLQSPSGDLVCASFSGIYDLGDDGYVDALGDALTSKAGAEVAIRFQTGSKIYRWLNRELFIGRGQRDFAARTLRLRIFSVDE